MFDDIISALASSLGVTDATAQFLISIAVMVSIGLTMTVARVNILGTAIVLIAVMGFFTVVGWFPLWVSATIILITGAMFAAQMAGWLGGKD